jgi:hypothetical protein
MKTHTRLLALFALAAALFGKAYGVIPVTDAANLANSQIEHIQVIAEWIDNIAQLKAQIEQLKNQVSIQSDLRQWAGDPTKAAQSLMLDVLNTSDLAREYGQTRDAIARDANSLGILTDDDSGVFRNTDQPDLDGDAVSHDPTLYRRFTVLNDRQQNARDVADETHDRTQELQEEISLTLTDLKAASTDAEVQKLNGKLTVLNGQLAEIENTRRREVDEVVLQQIANDSRQQEEQTAAAELRAKDDYIASQRMTAFVRTLNPYKSQN